MSNVLGGTMAALLVILSLFFIVLMGTIMGAFSGLIVGIFFSETILGTLDAFGVETFELQVWQLGATLGFIGGFFKSSLVTKGS